MRIALFALAALLLAPATASAASGPEITVMTRNLFLGADLSPAIGAPSIAEAVDGAGTVWNELQATKFSERAVPLAREIKRSGADLVGLQEVATWRKQVPSDGGAPPISPIPGATPATAVEQDFLKILRKHLGSSYRVAVVQEEFDAELPVDVDHNDATGTGPLAALGADFDARLTLHNVILVKRGSKVKVSGAKTGRYKARYEPDVGGIKIPVDRGWASVQARVGSHKFRFVDTHLEAYGDPKIRAAQARELTKGPLKVKGQVILVGDLNSGVKRHHEPEQPGDDLAFKVLEKFGMKDNGARQSCCYANLTDPKAVLDHTVDHILTKPGLKTVRAWVTGKDPKERTASGLWPSDHGGVVSRLRLR
ncbi:MAG TPA: endonuclease/exonuclease/phosphatase family protein [Solirubrobacter sp.]|nr:endonuclease/exonuclease/phosphatase family protein [Solirubrobacter sp.]